MSNQPAREEITMPDDAFVDRFGVTLEHFLKHRHDPPPLPALPYDDGTEPDDLSEPLEPFDSHTIDAEIIIARTGGERFTAGDLAAILGIEPSTVFTRLFRGALPKPRWHQLSRAVPHYWSLRQAIEILAAELRKRDNAA